VLGFPERPQRAPPPEQPVVQARLAHQSGESHLRQRLQLPARDLLPRQVHRLAGRLRVRVPQQQGLAPRHPRVNVRVPLRVRQLEKSAVREPDQVKQSPRAAELEKSEAREPDRRKQNHRAAVLNFRENPLGQRGNLHLKQQVPVKEPQKGHLRVPTGNRKGAKLTHLRPRSRNRGIESLA
jgi:hypothetical protein